MQRWNIECALAVTWTDRMKQRAGYQMLRKYPVDLVDPVRIWVAGFYRNNRQKRQGDWRNRL